MEQTDRSAALRWVTGIWAFARWWAALLVLWVALVGKVGPLELLAGAVAAGLAALGAAAVRARDQQEFALRPGYFALLARRLPSTVLRDCGRVIFALWLRLRGVQIEGKTREVPFDPGQHGDPEAAARRALVLAGISLPPNTFLLEIDWRHHRIWAHDLLPAPEPSSADREWPL